MRQSDLVDMAEWLEHLATELRRGDAKQTLARMGTAADDRFPSRASTVPAEISNQVDADGVPVQPSSSTEAKALGRDRTAVESEHALQIIQEMHQAVKRVLPVLWSWRSDRTFQQCDRCGHPIPRGDGRCRRIVDGEACNASAVSVRACRICERVMKPGEPLRAGRCNPCRMYRDRHGHDRQMSAGGVS